MKIALCLSGQYRTFDSECVQVGLRHFILDKYDCDTYFSTWTDRGTSVNHGRPLDYKDKNEVITKDHVTKYIPNAVVEIEKYADWVSSLTENYKTLLNALNGTIFSGVLPQLYKKYKSFQMINGQYDYVIVTRPDLLFWDDLNIENRINQTNIVWNINPQNSKAYYPNRIYDIFLMGHQRDMEKIVQCYFNIEHLTGDPFKSGLQAYDCCKMLYIFAKQFCGLEVGATDTFLSEAYRGEDVDSIINHYSAYCDLTKLKKVLYG